MSAAYLNTPHGTRIAYHQAEGRLPGVVFFPGFKSDMQGAKALALEEFCKGHGRAFVRFDYSGHGESSGDFLDGTIGQWKQDALCVLDMRTSGKQILVGSSMGGWIALLLARKRPERLQAVVTVAAAPDFTESLIWQNLSADTKQELLAKGVMYAPSCYGEEPYPITLKLIEEGRGHLLLNQPSIAVSCPVRLMHGMADTDVPWQLSAQLAAKLESADVEVQLVKSGNHRMSSAQDLRLMCRSVAELA